MVVLIVVASGCRGHDVLAASCIGLAAVCGGYGIRGNLRQTLWNPVACSGFYVYTHDTRPTKAAARVPQLQTTQNICCIGQRGEDLGGVKHKLMTPLRPPRSRD